MAIPIEASRLSSLEPLNQLPNRVLEYVADQAVLTEVPAQSVIHHLGQADERVCYLLQGDVETRNQADVPHRVSAGSKRGLWPLASRQPAEVSARAIGKVTLLQLPRELYESIHRLPTTSKPSPQPSPIVQQVESAESESYRSFQAALRDGKLELPSMPDIAMRIAKAINNPDTDSEDIARVVQADPTVAARLIRVVNSAAYRGQTAIGNLPEAVTRLGRNVIHNLGSRFALGSLFHSRSKVLHRRL